MTPPLIWPDDEIRYLSAANAPEVTASTAAIAATSVIPFFKIVPFVSPGPLAASGEQQWPGIFTLLSQ